MRPRHRLARLALACLVLLAAGPAAADGYAASAHALGATLPPGTATRSVGFPRYVRSGADLPGDPAARQALLRDWAAAAEATARTVPGTRLAGDLLAAAAHLHRRRGPLPDLEAYRRLARGALDAYREEDPGAAAALLGLAREELAAGNVPAAGRGLERLAPWAAQLDGERAAGPLGPRMAALASTWARAYRPLRAAWLEATGEARAAADVRAAIAASAPAARRGRRWQEAAEAYVRAHDRPAATEAVERAIEAASDAGRGGREANHRLWRLYLRHGMLDAAGRPAPLDAAAGWRTTGALREDLRALLHTLADLAGATTTYLELGSRAHLHGDDAAALEVYLAALDNPSTSEEALGRRDLWEGLLVAFPAAIRTGRFDDAERILETVARIGAIPAERFERLLVYLKNRRADAAAIAALKRRLAEEAARRREVRAPASAPGGAPDPRLELAPDEPPPEPEAPAPAEPEGLPRWIPPGAALLLLLLLLAAWHRGRGRQRRRR